MITRSMAKANRPIKQTKQQENTSRPILKLKPNFYTDQNNHSIILTQIELEKVRQKQTNLVSNIEYFMTFILIFIIYYGIIYMVLKI